MPKAERTRQFIIEQTAPIFNKQGYVGTSLSDLTAATGLTKGAIYGNFENKEEVALAAFDYNLGLVQAGVLASVRAGTTAREQLLGMVRFYRQSYPQMCLLGGCPVQNAAIEVDDAPPAALRQRVQAAFLDWKQQMVVIIEQGQQTGEFNPAANAGRYATLFIVLIEGGIMLAKATGEANDLFTTLNHVESLIETDLRA